MKDIRTDEDADRRDREADDQDMADAVRDTLSLRGKVPWSAILDTTNQEESP